MSEVLKQVVNFFTHDLMRKILALVLAFGLWLFVAIDGNYNYTRTISIDYINLPDNFIITSSPPRLNVTFTGKGKNLINLWSTPPKAVCNLSDVVPGRNVFSTRDLTLPIKDLGIDYEQKFIIVEVDEKLVKIVKPTILIKGSPKEGYALAEIEILDTLRLIGPKKILEGIGELYTESLEVNNKSISFEKNLRIKPLSELVKIIPENIKVRVVIDTVVKNTFTNIPIAVIKNPKQHVKLTHNLIDTLIIAGARGRLQKLNTNEIKVHLKVNDLVPGAYRIAPEIILPEFVNATYIKPQQIQIVVY
ncbi:MAG: CdaR family protein [candidate division WOR-3 bacterium]